MFVQTESKAQTWRAVAVLEGRGECLLFVGRSSTHVRGEYVEAYTELLDDEEKEIVTAIKMEQWQGTPDAGRWVQKNDLRVPQPAKQLARAAA
jgi:hypothetical protein